MIDLGILVGNYGLGDNGLIFKDDLVVCANGLRVQLFTVVAIS